MQLVERHIIQENNAMYKEIHSECFLSKNLYNRANYLIRKAFIVSSQLKEEGQAKNAIWIRYRAIQKMLQDNKDPDYLALPAKVSQHVLKLLDKNWASFFASIRDWKQNPSKYTGKPNLPKYKHKTNGRNVLTYTIQAISKKELKKGYVLLSGTKIKIHTLQNIADIKQVRVIPRNKQYIIEVIYNKQIEKHENIDTKKIAGGDIGLDNLITVTSNQKVVPLLINGRPLKSINQYYNKKKAKLQSYVGDKGISNRLIKLTNKRNNKINDALHKSSRFVVNHLIKNGIGIFVIGKNKSWKDEINIGSKNNQAFVCIPHARFIEMLIYKCELVGITIIIREESYTSKCSFVDFEDVGKHEKYSGKRVKRGLFVSKDGIKINADCNGSGNIIRKEFPNAFDGYGIEGVVVHPVRVHPYKLCA